MRRVLLVVAALGAAGCNPVGPHSYNDPSVRCHFFMESPEPGRYVEIYSMPCQDTLAWRAGRR